MDLHATIEPMQRCMVVQGESPDAHMAGIFNFQTMGHYISATAGIGDHEPSNPNLDDHLSRGYVF